MGSENSKVGNFVYFVPSKWGEIDRFAAFYQTTYALPDRIVQCVQGCASHFHRARRLMALVHSLKHTLAMDQQELETTGHSHGDRGTEITALVEASILSLYSSVDASRKIVTEVFKKCRGLPDSTRKTFQGAAAGTIDLAVPEGIRAAFKNATWYGKFRLVRDAVTHMTPGFCYLTKEGRMAYMHTGIPRNNKAFYEDDILRYLEELVSDVNSFLGQVFHTLNSGLKNVESWQMCGVFGGRVYSRFVRPHEATDFNSGRCEAFVWFEKPENPKCPFASTCGAYAKKAG